jgi:hypothetical protein
MVLRKIVLSSMEEHNRISTDGRQPTGWDTQAPGTSKEDMLTDARHGHSMHEKELSL